MSEDKSIHNDVICVRVVFSILEKVLPRLQHCNAGVILSATRVVMKYLDFLTDPEMIINYSKKLTNPLISLLSQEPEIVYVALKNINLIL